MNDKNIDKISDLIKSMRISLSNIKIYPEESDSIKNSISLCFNLLNEILSNTKKLDIGDSENTIIINGEPLKSNKQEELIARKFSQALKECGIHSFSFDGKINEGSLKNFLCALAKKEEFETGEFVKGIVVTEKVWVAVGDKDIVIENGKEITENLQGGVDELKDKIKLLIEAKYDATNIKDRYEDMKKQMALNIKDVRGDVLFSFFNQDVSSEEPSVKEEASSLLSIGKCRELIREVSLRKKELTQKEKEGEKTAAQLEKLKKSLNLILNVAKNKGGSEIVCEDLIKNDVLELLSEEWIDNIASGGFSLSNQVEDLINNNDLLFDRAIQDTIGTLIRNLDSAGKDEDIKKVVNKIINNLSSANDKVKRASVNLFEKIYPDVESCSNKEIFKNMEDKLLSAIERQTEKNSYKKLASILTSLAIQAYKIGDCGMTLNIVSVFKKHSSFVLNEFSERKEMAFHSIKTFAESEAVKVLISDFLSNEPARQKTAVQLAIKLGQPVVDILIKAIKQTADLRIRKVLTLPLKDIGDGAIKKLFSSIENEVVWENITRIIGVLDGIGHRELVIDVLKEMSEHYNPNIRRASLLAFKRLKYEELEAKAIELLNDEDTIVKQQAILFLRELKSRASIPKLIDIFKKLLKSKETLLLEAICVTLGELHAEEAIKIFKKILLPGKKLLFIKKQYPPALRITVLTVLAKFSNVNPEVKSILKRLKKDKDGRISRKAAHLFSQIE